MNINFTMTEQARYLPNSVECTPWKIDRDLFALDQKINEHLDLLAVVNNVNEQINNKHFTWIIELAHKWSRYFFKHWENVLLLAMNADDVKEVGDILITLLNTKSLSVRLEWGQNWRKFKKVSFKKFWTETIKIDWDEDKALIDQYSDKPVQNPTVHQIRHNNRSDEIALFINKILGHNRIWFWAGITNPEEWCDDGTSDRVFWRNPFEQLTSSNNN